MGNMSDRPTMLRYLTQRIRALEANTAMTVLGLTRQVGTLIDDKSIPIVDRWTAFIHTKHKRVYHHTMKPLPGLTGEQWELYSAHVESEAIHGEYPLQEDMCVDEMTQYMFECELPEALIHEFMEGFIARRMTKHQI